MSKDFDPTNLIKIKISDLLFNDRNPKDNEKEFEIVKKSLATNGLITAIFVREVEGGLEVVDGNQRVRAARELGYTYLYGYNLGKISEAEAKKLVLYFQVQVPFAMDMLAPLAVELESMEMALPFNEREMQKFRELEAFDMDAAFSDEEPIEEDAPDDSLDGFVSYKIKLDPDDFEFVKKTIRRVATSEDVNDGRALELLAVAARPQ